MGRRNCVKFIVAASIICFLVSVQPIRANLVNGQFTHDFTGNTDPHLDWSVEQGVVQHVLVGGDGKAQFIPGTLSNPYSNSTLSQAFTLHPQSLILSFDRDMEILGGETDTFKAWLLDSNGNSLVSVPNGTGYFYLLNSSYNEDIVSGMSVIGNTVSLNVSSWSNSDVKLVFDLNHEYEGLETKVFLDNVAVSVVPIPGAVFLGSIGLGYSGLRLRRRREL